MSLIVALDASTPYCSAAVLKGGRIWEASEDVGQQHSERLLEMLDAVLTESGHRLTDIDALAFGAGPGSFTGLRIACSVVQGLAVGLNVPVVPVGCLQAMAHQAMETEGLATGRILVMQDARMNEVYVASYDAPGLGELTAPCVLPVAALASEELAELGCGNAPSVFGSPIHDRARRWADVVRPTARSIALLAHGLFNEGRAVAAQDASPFYVRNRIALTEAERAQGLRSLA